MNHISKTIAKHPGVLEVHLGESSGVDYRYEVFFREGWVFKNGRMQGTRCGHFDTVEDFKSAKPIRLNNQPGSPGAESE
jgi:hypothetical protein